MFSTGCHQNFPIRKMVGEKVGELLHSLGIDRHDDLTQLREA